VEQLKLRCQAAVCAYNFISFLHEASESRAVTGEEILGLRYERFSLTGGQLFILQFGLLLVTHGSAEIVAFHHDRAIALRSVRVQYSQFYISVRVEPEGNTKNRFQVVGQIRSVQDDTQIVNTWRD
jgi:hypothetical protein